MELMEASLLDALHDDALAAAATWAGCLLAVATDVAKGMAYLHYHDVLHRDLKPANILLSEYWVAKVADFGSHARATEAAASGALEGTPPYMAPEMVQRRGHGKAIDVWSFGCVLAHMGTRAPPYAHLGSDATAEAVMAAVVDDAQSPIAQLDASNTPPPLLNVARQCVARAAEERPTFEVVASLLADAAFVASVRPGDSDPRPRSRLQRPQRGAPVASDVFRLSVRASGGGGASPPVGAAECSWTAI